VAKLKKMVVTGQEKLKGTCNPAQMTRQDASFLLLSALLITLAPAAELSAPSPEKNKIRRPPGQAGQKTTTRLNGNPRYGFDLQEANGLKGTAE